jgi:hypothetical protein
MTRQKFTQRKLLLRGPEQVERAIALLRTVPLDDAKPLEILVREEVKARKLDQNALMWVGPLKDITEQAWVFGRQHSAEVWHVYFKEQFLPDTYDADLCKDEGYQKWADGPGGGHVLVGSTTDLTIKGFAQYLDQVHAFGAGLGVEFHEPPPRGN